MSRIVYVLIGLFCLCGGSYAAKFDPKQWTEIAANDQGQAFFFMKDTPLEYDIKNNVVKATILTMDKTNKETPFVVRENLIHCSNKQFTILREESYGPYGQFVQLRLLLPAQMPFIAGSLLDSICIGVKAKVNLKTI